MRSIDQSFYNSKKWRKVAADYKKSVSGLCERCRSRGLYIKADIVHHKIYLDDNNIHDPSVTYNFKNLEALCRTCHNKEHFESSGRYTFNNDGELIMKEEDPPIKGF